MTFDFSGGVTLRYADDSRGCVREGYGGSATNVKAEYIWRSPEVGESGPFGGDDGLGGYAPLAVASASSTSTPQLSWVHGNHLGVPILWTDATGTSVSPGDYALPGFPGQSQTLADLYYNRYRDYDPTTGRYMQADPIGLEGDINPYAYAGNNPVTGIDPWGLDTAIIIGGGVSSNPFGHAAIAVTGRGVYSYGTKTRLGSNLTDYLYDQSKRRDSKVYILPTTRAQEASIIARLRSFGSKGLPSPLDDPLGAFSDTCATRTLDALRSAGIRSYIDIISSPFPADLERLSSSISRTSIFIRQGTLRKVGRRIIHEGGQ